MKVHNKSVGGAQSKVESGKAGKAESAHGAKNSSKAGAAGAANALKGDSKVDVSERAQMMQKAKDIASESSVDEAKVARLQKMIDEGKYSVDADKIADRLVDEHMLIPD
jgi:negative regulator of flagellin synthesis FlgM